MKIRYLLWMLLAVLAGGSPAEAEESRAAEDQDAGITFFEAKIRPVLVTHCYDCHSAESGAAEGGLEVDSREAIRAGGGLGPAVVPGDPESSWLLTAVAHSDPDLKMPPKQPQLAATVIADLKKWIEMGAPDPRDEEAMGRAEEWDLEKARAHWAYQKPVRSEEVTTGISESTRTDAEQDSWPRRDSDHFILRELERQGLTPSPDAPPRTLLRRLHFDLVGLPPTPGDWQRFQGHVDAEGLDAALEAEVDRLLASPQFGERWGRHWLDVARFGESSGKEANISFPYAWRYRDYVIDAFNEDVPFDRFLMEQIAGDLIPYENDAQRARLLIATGFLALGPKNLDEASVWQFLADRVDEQIDSVTRSVMASSVACARCHDHKFDPFSMQDYYALAGIFASTETYFGTSVSPANRVGGEPLVLPLGTDHPILHESIPAERAASLRAELTALQREQEEGRKAVQEAIAAGENPEGIFTLTDALRIVWRSGAIRGQLNKVSETGEALPLAMGVLDRQEIFDAPLLLRGEIDRPGDRVPRALPVVIKFDEPFPIPEDQSGRLQLAQWLTHPEHPLTSRVMVNRVWKHLFGAGLVRTVDNFGTTGEPPSHPQLLDHLALRFMENGWSVKQLVRELVLSRTYRQASDYNEEAFLRDPDNRLLWRASKRRLEAEAIRDAMLAASGELDLQRPEGSLVGRVIGDRPISLIGLDKRLPADLDGAVHRSVYLPVVRDRLPDVLDLFDFAEPSLVTGERETTNVPIQALYLMNSPFVQDRAEALAARLIEESPSDRQRVVRAFQWCYGRPPDAEEEKRALDFLYEGRSLDEASDDSPPRAWISFCQALLSTAEFRNLD
jgi:hypothetical protein